MTKAVDARSEARPRVSVVMLAFDHGAWIARAIESVLEQRADFEFELIIGEDCSGDDTRAIVAGYAARHPGVIRPLLRDRNVGMHRNFVEALAASRGDHVAILEGDDSWSDVSKLARQFAAVEAQPAVALCGHRTVIVDEADRPIGEMPGALPSEAPTREEFVLGGCMVHTSSLFFRRSLLTPRFLSLLGDRRALAPDFSLKLWLAAHGDIRILDRRMSRFRRHEGGASFGLERDLDRWRRSLLAQSLRIATLAPRDGRSLARRMGLRLTRELLASETAGFAARFRLTLGSLRFGREPGCLRSSELVGALLPVGARKRLGRLARREPQS